MASLQIIEEIKQRLDLVEYIGRSVNLKRAGRTYKALCPFHVEKTASFFVFPDTNTWHCFGACSEGGDIFSFIQKREGLTFREALRALANEAGLRLSEESEEQQQTRLQQERLIACCQAAASVFQQWLLQREDAEDCRNYIKSRALSAETIHRFGLGFAPNSWDNLLFVMSERGYDAQDLVLIGLARRKEKGPYYDALRNRLVFPIRHMRGHIVGFGGRVIYDDDERPKYINSPQSIIFDKSNILYGLDLAQNGIRKANRSVIVEGYIDVIRAHQAGFNNVVASLGTALTEKQLRLVTRYSPNVTLALDADHAGEKAAERGLYRILDIQKQTPPQNHAQQAQPKPSEVGDIRVLILPESYDPDQLIMENPEDWQKRLPTALPIVDYLIMQRINQVNLSDAIQKARVAADLLPLIGQLESTLIRHHYLQHLGRLLKIDEYHLEKEMTKYVGNNAYKQNNLQGDAQSQEGQPSIIAAPLTSDNASEIKTDSTHEANKPRELEAYLLYLMLQHPILAQQAKDVGLRADMWQKTAHREIWQALLTQPPASAAHLEEFIQDLELPIAQQVRQIDHFYAFFPPLKGPEWKKEAFNKLDEFFNHYEKRQLYKLQYVMDDLNATIGENKYTPEMKHFLRQQAIIGENRLKRQKQLHQRMLQHKS